MTKTKKKSGKTISAHFPLPLVEKMESLKEEGDYASLSDVIRDAIREWFEMRECRKFEVSDEQKDLIRQFVMKGHYSDMKTFVQEAIGHQIRWEQDMPIRVAGRIPSRKDDDESS